MMLLLIGIPIMMVLLTSMTNGLKKTSKLSLNTVTITVMKPSLLVKLTNVLLTTKTTGEMLTVQVMVMSIVTAHMLLHKPPNVKLLGLVNKSPLLPPISWPLGTTTETVLSIIMMDSLQKMSMPSTKCVTTMVMVLPQLVNYTNVSLPTKMKSELIIVQVTQWLNVLVHSKESLNVLVLGLVMISIKSLLTP